MFKNKFFLFLIFAVVLAIVVFSLVDNNTPEKPIIANDSYRTDIENLRIQKDKALKEQKDSPIEDKTHFTGLKYFAINPLYKVTAKLDILTSGQIIKVAMTGGETEEYEAYANATFELEGKKYALKLFKTPEGNLFLPFKDATSTHETYGAGRYLDLSLESVENNHLSIDFNLCYHPYCAYNHTFTCPVPPAENFLSIAIKAGERL
jgi:uncharacterized protein (DUF1684 family)